MKNRIMPMTNKEAKALDITPEEKREANRNAAFPSRLRALRKQTRLSQKKLAAELQVTTTTIVKFEQGDTVPDAQVLRRMAVFFNVSYDYLFCATDVKTSNVDEKRICQSTGLSETSVRLLNQIRACAADTGPATALHLADMPDYLLDPATAAQLLDTLNRLLEELGDDAIDGRVLEQISEYIHSDHVFEQPNGLYADSVLINLPSGRRKRVSGRAIARDHLESVISGINRLFDENKADSTAPMRYFVKAGQ
ncbi:helix-turn-helix domain-containing protein [Ruminococcaceae bacterium OttesenSCG-928-A11]|nr:helix-turn-helix domain-containing protein [Ruminococcaceae bacterium OttesenSCG-928-A11]